MTKKTKINFMLIIILLLLLNISIKPKEKNLKTFESQEEIIAIYVEDKKSSQIPTKDENYYFDEEKSFCNNNVSISWNYQNWSAIIDYTNYEIQNKERTYCNLYFKTREKYTFDSKESEQEFVVPKDGFYQVELWGAASSSGVETTSAGAYVKGEIYLEKDTIYYVYVGNMNAFNGGGVVYRTADKLAYSYGGGATDIRIKNGLWDDDIGLASRIIVAAGGGASSHGGTGGPGGALIGINGIPSTDSKYKGENSCGYGGTQISGGAAGYHNYQSEVPSAGSFGKGGKGENDYGGSGGGGYYGGGGSGINPLGKAAGGGGSSYISGYPGCIAIISETNPTPKTQTYSKIEDSYHYSGKFFINGIMIAGNEEMPTTDGLGTMTGNHDNGYAKITYLGK